MRGSFRSPRALPRSSRGTLSRVRVLAVSDPGQRALHRLHREAVHPRAVGDAGHAEFGQPRQGRCARLRTNSGPPARPDPDRARRAWSVGHDSGVSTALDARDRPGLDAVPDRPAPACPGTRRLDARLARPQPAVAPLRPHRSIPARRPAPRRDRGGSDEHLLGLGR